MNCKTMKTKTLLFALFFSGIGNSRAQEFFSLYNLGDDVVQTHNLSPVLLPKNKVTIGTPINLSLSLNAGFKINQLLREGSLPNTLKIDFQNLLDASEGKNKANVNSTANIITLAFKMENGAISFFSNARETFNWHFSKELIGLAANGLEDFNLKNEKLKATVYFETGIGITQKLLKDRLAIGLRLKLLNGVANISTAKDASLSLEIDPDAYLWNVNASQASLNTASINTPEGEQSSLFTGNSGFGMDFGARYELTEKWVLEIAVNDLGSINWSEDVVNYNIKEATNVVYQGIDLKNIDDAEEEIEEALENILDTDETQKSFKTNLSTRSYLSARYKLSDKNTLNAVVFNDHAFGSFNPSYSLGYNRSLKKVRFGLLAHSGGINPDFNLGANIAFAMGPVQFYAATDNLLNIGKKIEETSKANLCFGLNLLLGRDK